MGTVYRSICGCIASAPQPTPAEFETERQWAGAHNQWEKNWGEAIAAHHPYCCEIAKGNSLYYCSYGEDATCPVLKREVPNAV